MVQRFFHYLLLLELVVFDHLKEPPVATLAIAAGDCVVGGESKEDLKSINRLSLKSFNDLLFMHIVSAYSIFLGSSIYR